ncbi:DUF1672 family protein [Metabacillus lacus]|nr:DUF1672 family protein [Metabacillus lacus]
MRWNMINLSILLIALLTIGGCGAKGKTSETPEERHAREAYVSVNDYVGEGYDLPGGQKNDPIAKEKFEEIAAATEQFFLDKYKTEVIVHNAVGAIDGIMIFVESPHEPKFNTYALMPVNSKENKIYPDKIWTESGQVEQSLFGGLLAMIMEDEFAALDQYFEEFTKKHPVTGLQQEAINNVKKTGYTTSYYFIQPLSLREEMEKINALYLENPKITIEELRKHFDKHEYNAEKLAFGINLFMSEPGLEPNEEIFEQLLNDLSNNSSLPRGANTVSLHDNNINKKTGIGHKDNTMNEGNIVPIIRD